MKFLLGSLAFLVVAQSVCTVERIATCATTYLDLDQDSMISAGEINTFVVYQPCGPLALTAMGETVMEFCDRNKDGYMSQVDLEATPFNCLTMPVKTQLCKVCDQCDANPPGDAWYNMTAF